MTTMKIVCCWASAFSVRVLMVGCFTLSIWQQACAEQYVIRLNPKQPEIAEISLILDQPLAEEETFYVRSQHQLINVLEPVCSNKNQSLARSANGWLVPEGCNQITWQVRFDKLEQPSYDVSLQTSVYLEKKWWLFSEWGSLLRRENIQTSQTICWQSPNMAVCHRVPTVEEAPLFMLLGEPDSIVSFNGTDFRFFTGYLPNTLDVSRLEASLGKQLSYLSAMLRTSSPNRIEHYRQIDVLWLGIEGGYGKSGGAAGSDVFLANVIVENNETSDVEQTRLLWVSAHELSHMMGLSTTALWVNESLATYYAYKSMGHSADTDQIWLSLSYADSALGLLSVHKEVTQLEKSENYGLFYSKGAAFWKELDLAIIEASGGDSNLDDYLPLLLEGEFTAEGKLPTPFLDALRKSIGASRLDNLLSEYLY